MTVVSKKPESPAPGAITPRFLRRFEESPPNASDPTPVREKPPIPSEDLKILTSVQGAGVTLGGKGGVRVVRRRPSVATGGGVGRPAPNAAASRGGTRVPENRRFLWKIWKILTSLRGLAAGGDLRSRRGAGSGDPRPTQTRPGAGRESAKTGVSFEDSKILTSVRGAGVTRGGKGGVARVPEETFGRDGGRGRETRAHQRRRVQERDASPRKPAFPSEDLKILTSVRGPA